MTDKDMVDLADLLLVSRSPKTCLVANDLKDLVSRHEITCEVEFLDAAAMPDRVHELLGSKTVIGMAVNDMCGVFTPSLDSDGVSWKGNKT